MSEKSYRTGTDGGKWVRSEPKCDILSPFVAQNRRKLLVRSFRFVYSRACGTTSGASLAASSSPDMASSLTDATFDPRPALPISNPSFRSSDDPPAAQSWVSPGRRAFETDNPGFRPAEDTSHAPILGFST
jgi:hypothetical protein